MNVDDIYGPGWRLLHWNTFDDVRTWRPCADCGELMIAGDVAAILHPFDNPNHPSGLCAVLCEKCAREWLFP
jgi:hypothetical protein